MDMVKVKIEMRDTFSQCSNTKEIEVTREVAESLESNVGNIVKEVSNGITYMWKIEKVTILN